jgi:methylglutaconyl-CoA hydratase
LSKNVTRTKAPAAGPAKTPTRTPTKPSRNPAPAAGHGCKTITIDVRETVALVTLARPAVGNAFDATLVRELTQALASLDGDAGVRAVVLLGEGEDFCAGTDSNWLKETAGHDDERNLADAKELAWMLRTLYLLGKPTIARAHGSVCGPGVGLVACCDIAFAAHNATFSLPETKLGLIPAAVAPYVVEAIGARQARRYLVSAEEFTAAEAFRIGLVHDICPLDELDGRINELLGTLLVAGPRAQAEAKALVRAVSAGPGDNAVIADTVARIARVRGSPEGREGMAALLEHRAASWIPEALRDA